jgi:peroxiredoxin
MSKAPNFSLPSTQSQINLEDMLGSPIILVFYPEDETDVCSAQLSIYNQALPIFKRYNAKIVGISIDDMKSHEKFADRLNLKFPLLADNSPEGNVSQLYGVYDDQIKKSKRALFVLDSEGNIFWKQVVPYEVNPGAEGILDALDELNNK